MVLYTCDKCNKTYDHKGGYIKHLNRKLPCDKKNNDKKNVVTDAIVISDNMDVKKDIDNIDVNMNDNMDVGKDIDNMDVNIKIINLIQKYNQQMNVKLDFITNKINHMAKQIQQLESQNVTNVYINDKLKTVPT